jgi:hypothetical protein
MSLITQIKLTNQELTLLSVVIVDASHLLNKELDKLKKYQLLGAESLMISRDVHIEELELQLKALAALRLKVPICPEDEDEDEDEE